jgi:acetyl esterase/lipase
MAEYARLLSAEGFAAVASNYRLTGTYTHPAQEEDVFAVLDWIAAHAGEHALDPGRIGLTGSSAGGHLSGLAGVKAPLRGATRWKVRCMVPVCGVHDVGLWFRDRPQYLPNVRGILGGLPAEKPEVERAVSPIAHVHAGAPPCLAIHGDIDDVCPVNQSVLFVQALCAAGAQAELAIVPGVGHAAHMPNVTPPEPLGGAKRFIGFLRRHLREA